MTKVLSLIVAMSAPQQMTVPGCDTAQTVAGGTIYCCSLSSGQQCCSGSLDDNGKPSGCGC